MINKLNVFLVNDENLSFERIQRERTIVAVIQTRPRSQTQSISSNLQNRRFQDFKG